MLWGTISRVTRNVIRVFQGAMAFPSEKDKLNVKSRSLLAEMHFIHNSWEMRHLCNTG